MQGHPRLLHVAIWMRLHISTVGPKGPHGENRCWCGIPRGRIGRRASAVRLVGHIWNDWCPKGVPVDRMVALLPYVENWYRMLVPVFLRSYKNIRRRARAVQVLPPSPEL